VRNDSYLFITLDSCRYDAFEEADAPNMKAIAPLHMAMAPGYFTYGSHAAMFMGFTPGISALQCAFLNPKFGKIFKLAGPGFPGKGTESLTLSGSNIIDGFRARGHLTLGTSGNAWFNPAVASGAPLSRDFDHFYFCEQPQALPQQLAWLSTMLAASQSPVFAFVNINETHVPYWYQGAPWSRDINPCIPFGGTNDAAECKRRQIGCIQYVDKLLGPLLDLFSGANTIVCADHGDCWGEDGLWEHGIWHRKVFEVPLLIRLAQLSAVHG
jgi:hypothetical protein